MTMNSKICMKIVGTNMCVKIAIVLIGETRFQRQKLMMIVVAQKRASRDDIRESNKNFAIVWLTRIVVSKRRLEGIYY